MRRICITFNSGPASRSVVWFTQTHHEEELLLRAQRYRFVSTHMAPLIGALALAGVSSVAFAGEVKVGAKPLETDDNGKITGAARKAAVTKLENLPGEDLWQAHLWASLDGGAPGPLYIEFYDRFDGKRFKVWHHEESGYSGGKYLSVSLDLDGNIGFNKDHTYEIQIVQLNAKGKDVRLAGGGKVTLVRTAKEAEPEQEDDENGEDTGSAEDLSEQDALDSLGGGNDDSNGDGEPPEVKSGDKKGCQVGAPAGFSGLIVLVLLGAALGRERR